MSESDRAGKFARRVVRGKNDGIVSTGSFATNIQSDSVTIYGELSPIADLEAPAAFSSLPAQRTVVGREPEFIALDRLLTTEGDDRAVVICGLGGQGKSALAQEWARSRWTDGPVRWVPSDSEAQLISGLGDIAVALEPGAIHLGATALSERAIQWLATHPGWLIVLDAVTEPSHVEHLVTRLRGHGRFLITSLRPTGWSDQFSLLPLSGLEHSDAAEFLLQRAGRVASRDSPDFAEAAGLCNALGHLALAIEQAGAYISESGISIADYRQLLGERPADTLAARAEGVSATRTIARVWSITLARLDGTPLAADLLRLIAWLDGGSIPRRFIEASSNDRLGITEAIRRLRAFSLIQHDAEGAIGVHSLVQTLYRSRDDSDSHRAGELIEAGRQQATQSLLRLVPEDDAHLPRTWSEWKELLPQIEALVRHSDGVLSDATALLMNAAGTYAVSQGLISLAVSLFDGAAEQLRTTRGETDELTLLCQSNLAGALEDAGLLRESVDLYERTLEARSSALGEEHPDTLASRSNLASAYEASGDLERAVPMLERIVADSERIMGKDHPSTWISINNLAYAYGLAGQPKRAVPIFDGLLVARQEALGQSHPYTIATRHNLAQVLVEAGEVERASDEIEQALNDAVESLGETTPITLSIRDTLGHVRIAEGRLDEAIEARETALAGRVRVLGEDHPETLVSRNNLAHTLELAGDLSRATKLHEQTLDDRMRVLGPDHPHTLVSRNNVGNVYEAADDLPRAISTLDLAVTEFERVLGNLHPSSLNARVSHAYAHVRNGDLTLAHQLYEALAHDHFFLYGPGDERTKVMFMNFTDIGRMV